jgi:hypothetical protein
MDAQFDPTRARCGLSIQWRDEEALSVPPPVSSSRTCSKILRRSTEEREDGNGAWA